MGILFKYIMRCIQERKLRTTLIIIAVTLSAALFLATSGISDSMIDMQMKQIFQQIGKADVIVYPDRESPADFFNSTLAKQKFKDKAEYMIDTIEISGQYRISAKEKQEMRFYGVDLEDYKKLNTLHINKQLSDVTFEGTKGIISEKTANKYKLQVGDQLEIILNGVRRNVKIFGIASNYGIFLNEDSSFFMIVPYALMGKYGDTQGRPNNFYIKAKDKHQIPYIREELKTLYPRYKVEDVFDAKNYAWRLNMMGGSLKLMTFFVLFMSSYIVYTVFKVITLEKMPAIGTFRSIGADKKRINKVLIIESFFYGIIGGMLACIVGIGLLYALSWITMPKELRGIEKIQLHITLGQMVTTFLIANLVTFASSILPILKVSNLPVKEIVLNNITKKHKKATKGLTAGMIFVILSIPISLVIPRDLKNIGNIFAIVLCLVGTIKMIPGCIYYLSKVLQNIFNVLFGNIGGIASKNIKQNKSITNSITLISMGIACMLLINTLSSSIALELLKIAETNLFYDIAFDVQDMDKKDIKMLKGNAEVRDIHSYYTVADMPIEGTEESLEYIEGTNEKYKEFVKLKYSQDEEMLFKKLGEDRNIIMGANIGDRLGLKEGDSILLDFNGVEKAYTVIGFAETIIDGGNFAVAHEKFVRIDGGSSAKLRAQLKTSHNPEGVAKELKKVFSGRSVHTETRKEMLKRNNESNAQMINMLKGLSILTLGIGVIGVINNLVISFIERKKALAVYRSIGMSKKQMLQMILLEALATGLIGGILGVLTGIVYIQFLMPMMMGLMKLVMPMHYSVKLMLKYVVGGVMITLIASIVPATKSSKLNIIEAIKFE